MGRWGVIAVDVKDYTKKDTLVERKKSAIRIAVVVPTKFETPDNNRIVQHATPDITHLGFE